MCITHSDTNSNATISNGNTNTNCGGSGNGLHVEVLILLHYESKLPNSWSYRGALRAGPASGVG